MHKAFKSTIKTISTIAQEANSTKPRTHYQQNSVLAQLLSIAHEQRCKNVVDQTESSLKNVHCVPTTDVIDTIQQYGGTKELLTNSLTHIQQIGEANWNKNRYSLISTSVVYPDHWCPPLSFTRSPYHLLNKQSEHDIKDWYVSALGRFLSPSIKEQLWQLQPAEWSAFLQPYAANNYVELMGKFLAIFVLIDDHLVEEQGSHQQNITLQNLLIFAEIWKFAFQRRNGHQTASKRLAMEIHDITLKTNIALLEPCFHAWSAIADSYVELGADEAWCNRMCNAIQEWIELGIREVVGQERIKQSLLLTEGLTNIPVTLTSYDHPPLHQAAMAKTTTVNMGGMSLLEIFMRQRIATIGVPMMSLLLEQSCGLNLSSIDYLLRPSINVISIISVLVNELIGMARDLKGEPNTLLLYRQIYNCSLEQSIHFTLELHALAVKKFDQNVQDVLQSLKSPSLQQHVSIYMERLRLLVRGYAQWHHYSNRYKNVMALDETHKQILVFSVADGHNQRYNALQDALKQYQLHTMIEENL